MNRFKAVVFDWAGTMIDFGSFAPMGAFVEAFRHFGVEVSIDEARRPMGSPKREHIAAMLADPRISARWQATHGSLPDSAQIDRLFEVFVPINERVVAQYTDLVPGAKAAVDALRTMGMKIGSTTGYTRSIMERILPAAAAQGYVPDNLVCADDLAQTRPGPLAMYQCLIDLLVHPPQAVIKVDDTAPGIAEGSTAGCVTVGVLLSGNTCGRTVAEVQALSAGELQEIRERAGKILRDAGADHLIDTVADLPALVHALNA
ncbi:MAG: phosphonoacetaldehyde hydrolase [Burkholderiaceae bacterium]